MTSIIFKRREFLKSSAAIVGLGELGALARFGHASAAEPQANPASDSEIDRLVELIEATPHDKAVGVMVRELRNGMSYQQFLGALYATTVRHRPFHKILAHRAVHELSRSVGREERLLPLFWMLDSLKRHGVTFFDYQKERELKAPAASSLPKPDKAAEVFQSALAQGDLDSAQRGLIAISRSQGARDAFYRAIPNLTARADVPGTQGHRVIWGANAFGSQEILGWQPQWNEHGLLRLPLAVNLTQPARENFELARRSASTLPKDWASKRSDKGAVLQLLSMVREGKSSAACRWAHDQLLAGKVSAGSIWDAVFLGNAELMWGSSWQAIGRALHSVNTSNAHHFAFHTVTEPESRFAILLHAVDWTAYEQGLLASRRQLRGIRITDIEPVEPPRSAAESVEEIFALIPPHRAGQRSRDRSRNDLAAQLTFAYASRHADHRLFLNTARRLLCLKATHDVHNVKFPVFIFENYAAASPEWRPHLLAASAHFLQGTQIEDSPAMQQAREELKG